MTNLAAILSFLHIFRRKSCYQLNLRRQIWYSSLDHDVGENVDVLILSQDDVEMVPILGEILLIFLEVVHYA